MHTCSHIYIYVLLVCVYICIHNIYIYTYACFRVYVYTYIYIYVYTCCIWGWGSKKNEFLFIIIYHHWPSFSNQFTIMYYRRDKTFTTKGFLNHRESPRTSPWSSFRNIVGPSRSTWTRPWTCRRPWPGACNGYHHRSLRALCIPSSKMMNGVWAEIIGKVEVWASGWLHPLDIRANMIMTPGCWLLVDFPGDPWWLGFFGRGRPVRIEGPWDSVPMKSSSWPPILPRQNHVAI